MEEDRRQQDGLSRLDFTQAQLEEFRAQAGRAARELIQAANLREGEILVVGCSTSEVEGERIGRFSSPELGQAVFEGIWKETENAGVYLAAQCCEHLNRALIVENEAVCRYGWETVNVVPQPKAGGSFASAAYRSFSHPAAVERIRAHAGMDIGDTLIGMHLREVAVPLRIPSRTIGAARIVCARTRPKFIGGARAVYDESLM